MQFLPLGSLLKKLIALMFKDCSFLISQGLRVWGTEFISSLPVISLSVMSLPPFLGGKLITDAEAGVVAHCHHPGSLYHLEGATLLHKRFSGGNISWGAPSKGTAGVKRQESCVQPGCALAQCHVLNSVLNLLSVWREEKVGKCTPCLSVVEN